MKQIATRMKEPSSWAGIAVLLSFVFPHLGLSAEAATAAVQSGAAIAGFLSIVLPENK